MTDTIWRVKIRMGEYWRSKKKKSKKLHIVHNLPHQRSNNWRVKVSFVHLALLLLVKMSRKLINMDGILAYQNIYNVWFSLVELHAG